MVDKWQDPAGMGVYIEGLPGIEDKINELIEHINDLEAEVTELRKARKSHSWDNGSFLNAIGGPIRNILAEQTANTVRYSIDRAVTIGEAMDLGLINHHGHPAGDCCDEPDCYQAWEMYPDG